MDAVEPSQGAQGLREEGEPKSAEDDVKGPIGKRKLLSPQHGDRSADTCLSGQIVHQPHDHARGAIYAVNVS